MLRVAMVSFSVLVFSTIAFADGQKHELPDDPKAAVIVFDYVGGFTPPPKNDHPVMEIRGDGTVLLGNRFKDDPRMQAKISAEALQSLLTFAIDENKIFEFEPAVVSKQIADKAAADRANGVISVLPVIADAPTTVIRIHADGKEHEAKYYALSFAARQHRTIEPLTRLQNVAAKLQELNQRLRKAAP